MESILSLAALLLEIHLGHINVLNANWTFVNSNEEQK